MAILKFICYYYPWYRKALEYVIYRHDEETKEPILDANGNRMRREDFLIDGLNCTPLSFPMSAKLLNDRFRKNQEPGRERFMGQYIISYNPKDKEEGLLDTQRAHELSMRFIRECFPGLVGIACTHGDGDHHAGNIHTHFYFCTVKCSNEISSTMKYPETGLMGQRFRPSLATIREYREKLAELVVREGLHPDNMLGIAGDRITNGEYWIRDYYQKKLDEENQRIRDAGGIPSETVYKTEKQLLRDGILDTVSRNTDFPSFRDALLRNYGILLVEDSRGWRYGFNDSNRSFSAVTLGGNYRKETILETLRRNRDDPSRITEYRKAEERRRLAAGDELPDPDSPEACLAYLQRQWNNSFAVCIGISAVTASEHLKGEERSRILRTFPRVLHYIEKWCIRTVDDVWARITAPWKRIPGLEKSIQIAKRKLRKARNLRYWGDALRKGSALLSEMKSAGDPEAFRKKHEGELLEYQHAEKVLADLPDASEETLWKNVQRNYREVRDLENERKELRKTEEEGLFVLHELDFFDSLMERHVSLEHILWKKLEEMTGYSTQRMEPESRTSDREEQSSRQERHLIPPDYER